MEKENKKPESEEKGCVEVKGNLLIDGKKI